MIGCFLTKSKDNLRLRFRNNCRIEAGEQIEDSISRACGTSILTLLTQYIEMSEPTQLARGNEVDDDQRRAVTYWISGL